MAKILLIETSTILCSVALERDGKIISSRKDGSRSHTSLTAVFCDEVLREAGLTVSGLDALCISEGPGSYTGLRVGLSTAKGLCFGGDVPLLSVCSLDILAAMGVGKCGGAGHIVPMLDARRMEVFTAIYENCADSLPRRITPVESHIVSEGDFSDVAADTLFIGDGALKCRDLIKEGQWEEAFPEAEQEMALLAEREFRNGAFRDTAYFEPFYLKDFVITQSKKNPLKR